METPTLSIRIPRKINWALIFIAMVWTRDILFEYVRGVFMRLPLLKYEDGHPAIALLFIVVLLLALPQFIRRISPLLLFLPPVLAWVYLMTYILFPLNTYYLNENLFPYFSRILPLYFVGLAWKADENISLLRSVSIASILCAIFYTIFIGEGMSEEQSFHQGNMSYAYRTLPHVCLVCYYAITQRSKLNIVVACVGAIFLFSLGTRGAFLCFIVFSLSCAWIFTECKKLVINLSIGLLAVIPFIISHGVNLLWWFLELFARLGLSVRIGEKLLAGEISGTSNRDHIWLTLMKAIDGHYFTGYGLFGDWRIVGVYAHNFFVELWVHYGSITGSLLGGGVIFLISRGLIYNHNKQQKAFILVFVCSSFGMLMLSSSYLLQGNFYIMLGLLFNTRYFAPSPLMTR